LTRLQQQAIDSPAIHFELSVAAAQNVQ